MKIFLTILILSITTGCLQSQETKNNEPVLKYKVREPKIKSDKPPLLILLHGYGSNEADLFSFADQLPENMLIISARAPYELSANSYAWAHLDFSSGEPVMNMQEAEKSRKLILQFISQLQSIYSLDEKAIYLCGFSQGGMMSYSVGLTHPDLIKGIAVMSGRLNSDVKPMIAPQEKLAKLKVFISHGTTDNVLKIDNSRQAESYLKTLGIIPFYKEYPAAHTINKEMFADLLSWLQNN